MKKNLSADILEKYFRGECNENEIARINAWYDSFESDHDDISILSDDQQEMYRSLMLNSIRNNIKNAESDNILHLTRGKSRRFARIIYLAASIVAVFAVLFFVKHKNAVLTSYPT